jgi:hypothetical protein
LDAPLVIESPKSFSNVLSPLGLYLDHNGEAIKFPVDEKAVAPIF